ncbi:MAG: hypothetical protein JWP11_1078 [Frankiales bacterium]|nr:hypothetical protein [Frankiales bacterium]
MTKGRRGESALSFVIVAIIALVVLGLALSGLAAFF